MSVARRCELRPFAHPDKGKTFIVIDGQLRIDFRDGSVALQAGVVFVVPKGRAFFGARASLCIQQASVICSEMCNAERPLGVASTYSPRGPGEWPLLAHSRRPLRRPRTAGFAIAVGSKGLLSWALEPAPKRRTAADQRLLHNDEARALQLFEVLPIR